MYSFPPLRTEDEETIKRRQLLKIRNQIEYCYLNSPFYQDLLNKHNLNPENIKSFDDFRLLPVTTKEDLRKNNALFFAAPRSEWLDVASTSGTTGSPVYIPFTQNDLKRIAKYGAQTLSLSGLTRKDTVHIALPMSAWLWMAGFGFYVCFTTLGATALRFGPGYSEKSLETMRNMDATSVLGVPSFLVKLGMLKQEMGIELKVNKIFTIGESIMDKNLDKNLVGKKIEELWGAKVFSCYGSTEGCFLTVECDRFCGHHVNPDEVFIEILDLETLAPVEDGKEGLVAITPLGMEGLPLLRYINGDISFLIPERCRCGRMLQRLGPIFARNDQMMKIKGVMVYPEAIKGILLEMGIELFQIEAFTDEFGHSMKIYISSETSGPNEDKTARTEDTGEFVRQVRERMRRRMGVTLDIEVIERQELLSRIMPPEVRKPIIFLDKRTRA